MKKTLKILTLASAFAIASMSSMVPPSYADWDVYLGCSEGSSNCEIYVGVIPTISLRLDWILIVEY